MQTVTFVGKNGRVKSIRVGNKHVRMTHYLGTSKGGVTVKPAKITSRLNNRGQSIGHALKTGNTTTYFGKRGNTVTRLPTFF